MTADVGHAVTVLKTASRSRWLASRRKGLGGSEVAAVLGNPPDMMKKAEETLTALFVEGLTPRG